VFVDDSGRRQRWVRVASTAATAVCLAYVGLVATDLVQTGVGPLIAVPASGNGLITGFPDSAGAVPGLLAHGRAATPARPSSSAADRLPAAVTRSDRSNKAVSAATTRATPPSDTHPRTA
jgi:hypothetical protein